MRRTKAAALETRAKILQSALDTFSEKSFANSSLTRIAANVGLTKGALYWHFRNKNDLLLRLVEELCRRREESFKDILDVPGSLEKLKRFYLSQLAQMQDDCNAKKVHRIMVKRDEWPEDIQDNVTQIIKEAVERERNMVAGYIRKCQEADNIREDIDPDGIAVLLSSIFQGLCAIQIAGLLPQEMPKYLDTLFSALGKELLKDKD